MTDSDYIDGEVCKLAFGGQGIVRHHGMVVFVPFTAPGDHILCRVTQQKKKFAVAEVVSIQQPSSNRIEPLCPYFGRCGGCQLQHLNYATQSEQKKMWVEESLRHLQHPPLTISSTTTPWNYRRHVTLHLKPSQQGFIAGYIATDNRSHLAVNQCPIFVKPSDPILVQLQEQLASLECHPHNEGKVVLFKKDDRSYVLHFHFKQMPRNAREWGEKALERYSEWAGMLFSAPRGSFELGATAVQIFFEGLTIDISPRAFVQNHPEQSQQIYQLLQTLPNAGTKILDLYCGIGISSLLWGRQNKQVVGIEYSREAVKLVRVNAEQNGIANATFLKGDVKDVLEKTLNEMKPDLVCVNPPREGLDPHVVSLLEKYCPPEIVYISCMPPTLARDLFPLVEKGYQIKKCQAFDMFPQTTHVETLVHLRVEKI